MKPKLIFILMQNYKIDSDWILSEIANNTDLSILNYFPTSKDNPDVKKIVDFFYTLDILPHVVLSSTPAIFTMPCKLSVFVYLDWVQ